VSEVVDELGERVAMVLVRIRGNVASLSRATGIPCETLQGMLDHARPPLSLERTTALLRARVDYAFTPLRFLSALVQYSSNDRTFSSNVRFRWEYRPGSEVFVVYTDERDTTVRGYPGLRNRAFVVKVNRLFQF